ncbi:hypothetical protein BX616_001618 [Lobosporangium transversale]|nr:hypothetical protein BX616_001618 [Lobosporangium transversale]
MNPNQASRRIIGSFYSALLQLGKYDLNHLPMQDYPTWARRVVHAERKRRKDKGVEMPTRSERRNILDFGEGIISQPNGDQQGSVGDDQQQLTKQKKGKAPKPTPEEFDGEYLHTYVIDEVTYDVVYDKTLSRTDGTLTKRNSNVWGHFVCKTEDCGERKWDSSVIATNLRFCRPRKAYKVTLHAQKCNQCEQYAEPIVEVTTLVKRVVYVLDLWMGFRAKEPRKDKEIKSDGPHDTERCHGCEVNECPYAERE